MRLVRPKKLSIIFALVCIALIEAVALAVPGEPAGYKLGVDQLAYEVGYAHLDTQWQWLRSQSISQFIPNTVSQMSAIVAANPNWVFSFTGAYRYKILKTNYPAMYTQVKNWIASGNWAVSGGEIDEGDVMSPMPEGLIRQILYGNGFFEDEFGKTAADLTIPDCFGYPKSLPTICAHCGLLGFGTQKFDIWGGWTGPAPHSAPFGIGRWMGPDGSVIISCLKPGSYSDGQYNIWTDVGDSLKNHSGVWASYDYIGTGDQGGGPSVGSVQSMFTRIAQNAAPGAAGIKVINASADQIFRDVYRDLTPAQIASFPTFQDELVMTTHGTGCYTSHADVKWRNRKNEQLSLAAEGASVLANWATNKTFAYPSAVITKAQWRYLQHQMHDDITGTSIPGAYVESTIPDADSSIADFTTCLNNASTAMAQILDTRVGTGSIPVVVYNQVGSAREDVVEASVNITSTNVLVYGPDGIEVPSQVVKAGSAGGASTIAFVASVPALSYSVFEVKPSTTPSTISTGLSVTANTLSNSFYTVTLDANGNISSIKQKPSNRELLSSASQFEEYGDNSSSFPAWEILYEDINAGPRSLSRTGVQTSIVDNGPARVSVQSKYTIGTSVFTQIIQLCAGAGGCRIEVPTTIDWKTGSTLLKMAFNLNASNANGTWDCGIGAESRPNANSQRYEVPGLQWSDITNSAGDYGVSILTDIKMGWHKPSNSKMCLTCIHSPAGSAYGYSGDQFVHNFRYGIYGHDGNAVSGNTVSQGLFFNYPLVSYATTAHAPSVTMGKQISFLTFDKTKLALMAVKLAEKSTNYIVRVREITGSVQTGATIAFPSNVTSATDMLGSEKPNTAPYGGNVVTNGKNITFSLPTYGIKTFSITLDVPSAVSGNGNRGLVAQLPVSKKLNISVLSRIRTMVSFALQSNETVKSVEVHDIQGRMIRKLGDQATCNADISNLVWDGKNNAGSQVAKGIYIFLLRTTQQTRSSTLILN